VVVALPSVSCVMTAFNYERYVGGAIRSVLAQDYPEDLLEVVVVDDGSSDGTAAAVREVQAAAPGRVVLIRQDNAGLGAATQTALDRARGELVAICDADDEWLPGKVMAQAEILASRPEVTLVYGDMRVIDEHGSLLDQSFFARQRITPLRGRVLDQLVAVNFTSNSTLMLRAAHVRPIPVDCPYADYWLVLHAAAAGELEVIDRPLSNYRLHGANMGFGATDERLLAELKRELTFRRLALTGELADSVGTDALARATLELKLNADSIGTRAGVPLHELLPVPDEDRALARAELVGALAAPQAEERVRLCARAALLDPLGVDARAAVGWWRPGIGRWRLGGANAELDRAEPGPVNHGRRITVGWAQELVAVPELLSIYCERVESVDDTLVIVAAAAELSTVATQLRDALTSVGVDPDDCPDLAVVPATADLSTLRPHAALTCGPELGLFPGVPSRV
jgi:glycosyltransferase involved in cell wall biosynthesis